MTKTEVYKELERIEHDIERHRLEVLLKRKGEEFQRLSEEANDIYREYLIIYNQYNELTGRIVHNGKM